MRFKLLALIAAGALLAACETAPEQAGATGGTGAGAAATTTTQAPSIAPGSQQDFVVNVGDRVFFGFDKYDLTDEAQAALRKQAAWLQKYPSVTVTVEGHCDERGTREYNLALGERRANAVKDYLTALGIDGSRVNTISYGKERPVAMGHDEEAWSQNRRGVTTITAGAAGS